MQERGLQPCPPQGHCVRRLAEASVTVQPSCALFQCRSAVPTCGLLKFQSMLLPSS